MPTATCSEEEIRMVGMISDNKVTFGSSFCQISRIPTIGSSRVNLRVCVPADSCLDEWPVTHAR